MTPAAVVLIPDRESRPTALGIVRCLGRAGLPVIAVSSRRNTPSLFSRYVTRRVLVPSLEQDPDAWMSGLIAFARSLVDKPVLYPSSDEQVWAIHKHRDELARYFRYAFLSDDTLLSCIDKREMYRMCKTAGIETGQVLSVPKGAHSQDVVDQVVFPTVLKPAAWVHLSEGRSPVRASFSRNSNRRRLPSPPRRSSTGRSPGPHACLSPSYFKNWFLGLPVRFTTSRCTQTRRRTFAACSSRASNDSIRHSLATAA